jgi:ABC-type lipoprotein release transport system permease subunit
MRLFSGVVTGIDTDYPVVFVGVVAFLVAVTLLASYLPARRIGRIDPVSVLREE